jgi:hypothetical protein
MGMTGPLIIDHPIIAFPGKNTPVFRRNTGIKYVLLDKYLGGEETWCGHGYSVAMVTVWLWLQCGHIFVLSFSIGIAEI